MNARAFTESRVRTLESMLETCNRIIAGWQRVAGDRQAQLDAAQAQYRRMARYLDESRPGWRDEMRREITGGTEEQWAKQEGSER